MNRRIAGYDVADTDVSENVKRSTQPMLFVHGEDDPTVPFENAPRAYELCPNDKDHLFTSGTRHIETMFTHPNEYAEKLDAFIDKYIQ